MVQDSKKRRRESTEGLASGISPEKRIRQALEKDINLSKLYDDLAAESEEIRLQAAKKIIIRFSPENDPSAEDISKVLNRLIRGLCSQRKAARVGFCITLTELLRQLFGQKEAKFKGLDDDAGSILKMVEQKTKVQGNVSGQERRDHLVGKLFGYKAIMQSSIVIEPELSVECWNKLLDCIYGMARDIPWLREECGLVLVEAADSLKSDTKFVECARELVQRLNSFKLARTAEGVAIWLAVRAAYPEVLPEDVWYQKDPLSKKDRSRLAKILKEDYRTTSENNNDAIKSAAANPNPVFAWNLVLSEVLRRDENLKEASKAQFPQFWLDTVDSNLFSLSASHERKSWGFKLFANLVVQIQNWAIPFLFSPNLMRTLINQSKREDRFLHASAMAALRAIHVRVDGDPPSALPLFVSLTTKTGTVELDKFTRTKTLEQILLAAEDEFLKEIVRHLRSLILRPGTEEQNAADSRRQTITDLLLSTVRSFKRYESQSPGFLEKDSWLRNTLDIMVEHAYFSPKESAKTSKVPLPPISESNRKMFQERLSSCLTRLLGLGSQVRITFPLIAVDMIRSKAKSSKSLHLLFKADQSVLTSVENAFRTLDAISTQGSIAGNSIAAHAFMLLYSLTLLQIYNGDGDAVMMLEDLDVSRQTMLKNWRTPVEQGQDTFVEILLSFLGNPRTLFRKIAHETFAIFTSSLTSEGLKSLADILDTEENLEGQKELFNQDDDGVEDLHSSSNDDDDSDVEMLDDGEDDDTSESSELNTGSTSLSDSDENEDGEEEGEELTEFNKKLSIALQTSNPMHDGNASDASSPFSDMDDEQMMALDPHLTKIFQQRSKSNSKKKDREVAKQNVAQFKSRVLDLLAVYLEKEYSNPLTLEVILPLVRRTRANANKQLAEKSSKLLKAFFDSRTKHKAPLPKPGSAEHAWEVLHRIHEETGLGSGAVIHANCCSSASLHVVKVLMGLDKDNYARIMDVYAGTQKAWFMEKSSHIQPILFTQFQNWSMNTRKQGR